MKIKFLVIAAMVILQCGAVAAESPQKVSFEKLRGDSAWSLAFDDSCTGNWEDNWFLDGKIARVENSEDGMNFIAGPEYKNNAHHGVLWTKQSFAGDVMLEFEYTRSEAELRNVNIFYIQASGIGEGVYDKDISKWSHLREVPHFSTYCRYMEPIHISFAGYPMVNTDPKRDYLRVRKYPEQGVTFHEMEVEPTYYNTNLFLPYITYKVIIIKTDDELYMSVVGGGRDACYRWNLSDKRKVEEGRMGMRHMNTRSAYYKNFKVYTR